MMDRKYNNSVFNTKMKVGDFIKINGPSAIEIQSISKDLNEVKLKIVSSKYTSIEKQPKKIGEK